MDFNISGRTALVCASTSGLGLASARALANEGVHVAIHGHRRGRVVEAAGSVRGAVGITADLGSESGADDLAAKAVEELGHVDILVLNGPGPKPGPAAGLGSAELRGAIDSLLIPQARLVELLVSHMCRRNWGRVVAIESSGVQAPLSGLALSNVGRPATMGLLKTLATEVAADGVTINAALPGRIATNRVTQVDDQAALERGVSVEAVREESFSTIPAGRYGQPDEFGAVVAFLSSTQASFITGTAVRVDGGMLPII